MLELSPRDKMKCPHCGYIYDEVAADFVVSGHVGIASEARDTCPECDVNFVAYKSTTGAVRVRIE